MKASRRGLCVLVLCPFVLIGPASAPAADPIRLGYDPVLLDPEHPDRRRVGRLRFLGGLDLWSDDPRFGGFSGLLIESDGRRLTAVSDKGFWLSATLRYDRRGFLAGIGDATIEPFLDEAGKIVTRKTQADAEGLARTGGRPVVSFERRHRIATYETVGGKPIMERLLPRRQTRGKSIRRNKGIEALTSLAGGRLLALMEGEDSGPPDLPGWVIDGPAWYPLIYPRRGMYRPTGAATLPSGDVLVLERRATLVGGLAARIVRVPERSIRPGGRIVGTDIAVIDLPLTVENYEGIATRDGPGGKSLIYLISDDNYTIFLRTLLLMFELDSAGK